MTKGGSIRASRVNNYRRGVGAIIGGVILAAILLTTIFAFFFTMQQSEQARAGYEIKASQVSQDRSTETFTVDLREDLISNGGNLYMNITINNVGPIPLRYSHVLLYCISATCPSTDPIENPPSVDPNDPVPPVTLNAGETSDDLQPAGSEGLLVGPVVDTRTYRVDVISERGNIVSAILCEVAVDICINPNGGGGNGGNGGDPGIVPEGIIQGTGSLQLDYKSFGAIFPQFAAKDNVAQTGWLARAGNATGYPAFMLPAGPQVYIVERVRNLDPQEYSIDLGRSSGMTISQGKCTSGQCPPVYLCMAGTNGVSNTTLGTTGNLIPGTVAALNDPTNYVSIPVTPQTAGRYDGWKDIVLCSNTQNSLAAWNVQGQMSNINSAFMVSRGIYGGTDFAYAQNIPYQSLIVANQGAPNLGNNGVVLPNMIACLRDPGLGGACSSPLLVDAAAALRYQGAGGALVDIHVNNNCACGYTVSWIYPNSGEVTRLVNPNPGNGLNGNGNIPITVPTINEDGTPIDPGYYTIMLTTGYNVNYERDVYYFTFRVV